MPKRIIEDIVVNRNSVRSSLLDETNPEKPSFLSRKKVVEEEVKPDLKVLLAEEPPKSRKNKIIFASITAGIVLLFFLVSSFFAGATLAVSPTQKTVPVDTEFGAIRGSGDASALGFELVKMQDTLTKEIPANGTKNIERKATGQIVVYNNFDSKEFKLVKDTRFETADGKIYRVTNALTIPGRKTVNGKVVPGSIEATVLADKPGAEYNIPLSDFTLPGLKSDPEKYKAIFARSKTPMAGGYAGKVKVVEAPLLESTQKELDAKLEEAMLKNTKEQVPQDAVLFDGAIQITYSLAEGSEVADADGENDSLEVKEVGTLYGVIFDKRNLARFLAEKLIPDYEGEPISVDNWSDLKFHLEGELKLVDTIGEITFTLTGNPHFVWGYDAEGLKTALVGAKKGAIGDIVKNGFPTIEKIDVRLQPPWRFSIPKNAEKIKIKEE